MLTRAVIFALAIIAVDTRASRRTESMGENVCGTMDEERGGFDTCVQREEYVRGRGGCAKPLDTSS